MDKRMFPGNLGLLLDQAAEDHARVPGIGVPENVWTFEDILDRVCRLAHGFQHLGLQPGDRVVFFSSSTLGYALVSLALFRMAGVLVPLNPRIRHYELAHILGETLPAAVICDPEGFPPVKEALRLNQGQPLPHILFTRSSQEDGFWIQGLPFSRPRTRWENVTPDETAMIVYTAAMEGYPLGAQLTHGSLFWDTLAFGEACGPLPNSGFLYSLLPLFHSYGFTNGFLVPLWAGVPCLLLGTSLRGAGVVQIMEHLPAQQVVSVPAIFHTLFKPLSERQNLCASIQNLVSGGIQLPMRLMELYEEKLGLTIREGYGLTEASPVVTWNDPTKPPKFGSVGRPLSCCQIQIVDREGQPLGAGQEGEVLVKGSNLFSGYLGQTEQTRKAFQEGWFHTGDIGRVDEEGYLTLTGLKKEMINVFGLKAYPREIERILRYHPAVESVHVKEQWEPRQGPVVSALVKKKPGAFLTEKELLSWCRGSLSPYKVPRVIQFI